MHNTDHYYERCPVTRKLHRVYTHQYSYGSLGTVDADCDQALLDGIRTRTWPSDLGVLLRMDELDRRRYQARTHVKRWMCKDCNHFHQAPEMGFWGDYTGTIHEPVQPTAAGQNHARNYVHWLNRPPHYAGLGHRLDYWPFYLSTVLLNEKDDFPPAMVVAWSLMCLMFVVLLKGTWASLAIFLIMTVALVRVAGRYMLRDYMHRAQSVRPPPPPARFYVGVRQTGLNTPSAPDFKQECQANSATPSSVSAPA